MAKIKVLTHSNPDWSGTSLLTEMDVSYQKLVALFGKPDCFDNYKTDAEWIVEFDGHLLTIYNYKDGKNYNGTKGLATEDITDWHIGGFDHSENKAKEFARKIQRMEVANLLPIIEK